jgi:hypothetical protein
MILSKAYIKNSSCSSPSTSSSLSPIQDFDNRISVLSKTSSFNSSIQDQVNMFANDDYRLVGQHAIASNSNQNLNGSLMFSNEFNYDSTKRRSDGFDTLKKYYSGSNSAAKKLNKELSFPLANSKNINNNEQLKEIKQVTIGINTSSMTHDLKLANEIYKRLVMYTEYNERHKDHNISVCLETAHLWQQFSSIGTEMIITKSGR